MASHTLMVQFRDRQERTALSVVRVKVRGVAPADDVARMAIDAALADLRHRHDRLMPLCDLEAIGISDGRRVAGEWVTVGVDPRAKRGQT